MITISIHALLAESDWADTNYNLSDIISIHALLAESDCDFSQKRHPLTISIHALLAESDNCTSIGRPKRLYFYPRSPCGERPLKSESLTTYFDFYPRSPCGERRFYPLKTLIILPFLSTLSLRRATISCAWSASKLGDFYPRSPCGERPSIDDVEPSNTHFYPRSPCGERH